MSGCGELCSCGALIVRRGGAPVCGRRGVAPGECLVMTLAHEGLERRRASLLFDWTRNRATRNAPPVLPET